MRAALKRLSLGISLIALTSTVLVLSDTKGRHSGARKIARIAILQHANSPVLDDGVAGMIEALDRAGFRHGTTAVIDKYNATGDMAIGNAIATQITNGEYDLVLTSSTPSMQAVARANREGRTIHVFGVTADPFSAGIGLDRSDPLRHPRHIVGQGVLLPVIDSFRIAKRMFPGLQRVGVAWNPAESNSVVFTEMARAACRELGITLLETNVESTSGVLDAVNSLAARGAQALWIGGDNTMMAATDTALIATRRARIPAFTITPGRPDRGTALDVGLDFVEVGRLAGSLAADVLKGTNPALIPIRNVVDIVPRRVIVNTLALRGLLDPWQVPDDVRKTATIVVDDGGVHSRIDSSRRN
jgi:putative ABC transport system substrate-binding protein